MANFWDLPKAVRESIYRMHLVQDTPIDLESFKAICLCRDYRLPSRRHKLPRIMPPLFEISSRAEREASHIYFAENVFQFKCRNLDEWFKRLWPRHANHIRSICITFERHSAAEAFEKLKSLRMLESLTMVVDEAAELRRLLGEGRCTNRIRWHDSLTPGPQIYLHMLRAGGMTALRALRGVQKVEFLHPKLTQQQGSMPGSFFETIVKPEIMQSKHVAPYVREGSFSFLNLPLELRIIIYDMLMVYPGVMFPSTRVPTSITQTHVTKRPSTPHSALDILCVNHQIHDEALQVFYGKNEFVFPKPTRLQTFMASLGIERLDCLRSLTLFYQRGPMVGEHSTMDSTLATVRLLRSLQKLHILVPVSRNWRPTSYLLEKFAECNPAQLDGVKAMFSFRKLKDFRLLGPHTDGQDYDESSLVANLARLDAIYRHFNYGLRLAQAGRVFTKLYTERNWAQEQLWLALDGTEVSKCGFAAGCVCGQSDTGE